MEQLTRILPALPTLPRQDIPQWAPRTRYSLLTHVQQATQHQLDQQELARSQASIEALLLAKRTGPLVAEQEQTL